MDVEGLGVKVRVLELGEGPAVLFIHGGNVSAASWADLAARLPNYRCILVDRPGCGLSQRLQAGLTPATLPQYSAALVTGVLDGLQIEAAHVVATSFGSAVALRAAVLEPARVRRMVLFGWPFGASRPLPAFMRMMSVPGVASVMSRMPPTETSVRMMFRGIGHAGSLKSGKITPGDVRWLRALLRDTDTLRNEFAMAFLMMSPRRGLKDAALLSDDLLSRVTAPVSLIWGGNDPFGGESVAKDFVRRLPTAELELLAGAGHAPWLDEPERCSKATDRFLA